MLGKPGNEALNTTVTKYTDTPFISSSYVQLLQLIYCCNIARYDFANAILILYFAHFQYS